MLSAFVHAVHAARHSFAGFKHLVATELAARIEVFLGIVTVIWFVAIGRSLFDILGLLVLFCILMSVEALNTAVERIVDRLSPERSEFGRIAKDLGSTAVFFMLSASALYVLAMTADAFGVIAL